MTSEKKKNESIRCACGKVDLYEEWLKQHEKAEISDSASTNQSDDGKGSDEDK